MYRNFEVRRKVEGSWKDAAHSTWFYRLWLIFHGILLESRKEDPGVMNLFGGNLSIVQTVLFCFFMDQTLLLREVVNIGCLAFMFLPNAALPGAMHDLTNLSTTISAIVAS